jgi:hypothetical protein
MLAGWSSLSWTELVTYLRKFLSRAHCPNLSQLNHISLRYGEPGSSASIVSGYGLADRAIEVRFPAEEKDVSSNLCVQTDSGAHPASCTMGTGGPFVGTKARPGRDADHSPPSSAEVENE